MAKFALFFSMFLASSAQAASMIKDCTGSSDLGPVEVQISPSTVTTACDDHFQGYYQANILLNGSSVYMTEYAVFNPADQQYFTEGNSDFVLAGPPINTSTELYLHVWNPAGTVSTPSFDKVAVSCQ
jgi:hypothetical protein